MDTRSLTYPITATELVSAKVPRGSTTARVGVLSGDDCPDLFPADLLTVPSPSETNGSLRCGWWLAHTRPRQEKALATALFTRQVGFYLPLILRKSLTRGRPRMARIALFPGYVFIYGDDHDRLCVLQTNRVVTIHEVPDGEQLREDLSRFAEAIAKGAPLVREARLVAGEIVRVKAGPFRGTEGTVIRRNGKTRLVIAINYLQQGASLEVDDCLLEPL